MEEEGWLIFSLILSLLLTPIALAQEPNAAETRTFTLQGEVREKGTRVPLADQNVFILPHQLKTTTDAQGRFMFEKVPEGSITWIVNRAGYLKLQENGTASEKATLKKVILSVEKQSYAVYETTVIGKGEKRDDTQRTLKKKEFLQMPGSNGDPLKAIQNLPGVNRAQSFSSQVIIQGSAPQDTRYQVDGHEVPIIFHFGGLTSVVVPEALDRVDYLTAGYGPEFGRAMGGIVGVTTEVPSKERWKGFVFADAYNAGGLFEGPVAKNKKSSLSFGARTSYISALMKGVAAATKTRGLDLTVSPTFSDGISVFQSQFTHRDQFKLVTLGSLDTVTFLLDRPAGRDSTIRFYNRNAFFRLIPQLIHKHSDKSTSRLSFGFGKDWSRIDVSGQYADTMAWNLTSRAEHERIFNPFWTGQWGWDLRYRWVDFAARVFSSRGGVEREESISAHSHQLGFYWRNELRFWRDSPLVFMPHVRFDYFPRVSDYMVAPRMAIRYTLKEDWLFRVAGGLYSQPPTDLESDPTFGNPSLKIPTAWHFSSAVEYEWKKRSDRTIKVMLGNFYRSFNRLVIGSTALVEKNGSLAAENYNNNGKGRSFGGELLFRVNFGPVNGWIAYTLSRSTRWDNYNSEYLFRYDQTHILTALAGWDIGKNWRIATRARVVTGNPYTPISQGIFDSDTDGFAPVYGDPYSARLDTFFQWDLRVDKRFIFKNWILSMYLDIQNVTYQKNPELVAWAYDYSTNAKITGLPILPLFGLKAEF